MKKILILTLFCYPLLARFTCRDIVLQLSQPAVKHLKAIEVKPQTYREMLGEYFEIYMGLRPWNKQSQIKIQIFQKMMQRDEQTEHEITEHLQKLFEDFRTKNKKKNYALINIATEVNVLIHPKKTPSKIKKPLVVVMDWQQHPLSKELVEAADLILQSIDGEISAEDSKNLNFSQAKILNFSGGFAEKCLATGVASVVSIAEKVTDRSIQIVLDRKEIYFEHSFSRNRLERILYQRMIEFFDTHHIDSTNDTPIVLN